MMTFAEKFEAKRKTGVTSTGGSSSFAKRFESSQTGLSLVAEMKKKQQESEKKRQYEEIVKNAESIQQESDKANSFLGLVKETLRPSNLWSATKEVVTNPKELLTPVKEVGSALIEGEKRLTQGLSDIWSIGRIAESKQKEIESNSQFINRYVNDIKTESDPQKKLLYNQRIADLQNKNDELLKGFRTDLSPEEKRKVYAGAVETGIDLGTLGLGSIVKGLFKTGAKQVAKEVAKKGILQTSKNIAEKPLTESAIFGGTYGVTGKAYGEGDHTAGDYAKSGIVGSALGLGLGIGGKYAAKLLEKRAIKIAEKNVNQSIERKLGKVDVDEQSIIKEALKDGVKEDEIVKQIQDARQELEFIDPKTETPKTTPKVTSEAPKTETPTKTETPKVEPQVKKEVPTESKPLQKGGKGKYHTLVTAEDGGTKFLEAPNAKPVPNKAGLDLFVSKNNDGLWVVSEAKSGKALTGAMTTRKAAIDSVDYTLQKAKERGYDVNKVIDESVSKYGVTPKYSANKNDVVASLSQPQGITPKPPLQKGGKISAQQAKASGQSFDEWVKGQEVIENKNTGGIIKYKDGELKYSVEDGVMIIDNINVKTQKQGTGTALMKKVEDIAETLGIERIELGAFPQNKTIKSELLKKFYEDIGYEVDSDMPFEGETYYDMSKSVNGNKIDFKTRSQLKAEWDKKIPQGITPKVEVPKIENVTKTKESSFAERLNKELPEGYKISEEYEVARMKEEAIKASELIKKDKQKALRIATGIEKSDDLTQTATSIELGEIAKRDGDWALVNELFNNRRISGTRRGQEIAMEKMSVLLNPEEKFMKDVVNARLGKVKLSIDEFKKASEKILEKSKKITEEIKKATRKTIKIEKAQELLDSLICK